LIVKLPLPEDGVDDAEDEDEEEEADDKPETRKEKQLVWDLVNDNKAIWLRKASEVTSDEYSKFYKAVSKVRFKSGTPGPAWFPPAAPILIHSISLSSAWMISMCNVSLSYSTSLQNFDEPLSYSHFKAEGDIEFKTVLFIPTNSPAEFYDKYYNTDVQSSIKLYVRRVFISDEIPEIIPR
jgi:heat shock protein beta